MRPRITKQVREGWDGTIRPLITCILENGDEFCIECRNPDWPDPETCPCEGCVATRAAWKAIAWIDSRI